MKNKMNNKGFTLLESMICFVLLGILLVAAGQIIASSTQVYHQTKSTSYGIQVSQAIATEIRGDIEEAQLLKINPSNVSELTCVGISSDGKQIVIVSSDGKKIRYSWSGTSDENPSIDSKLTKYTQDIYDSNLNVSINSEAINSEYSYKNIGMGYVIKNVNFSLPLQNYTGVDKSVYTDSPVIKLELILFSDKYGEYKCVEYIPLYNFTQDDKTNGRINTSYIG